jgi:hypothetical protein
MVWIDNILSIIDVWLGISAKTGSRICHVAARYIKYYLFVIFAGGDYKFLLTIIY